MLTQRYHRGPSARICYLLVCMNPGISIIGGHFEESPAPASIIHY